MVRAGWVIAAVFVLVACATGAFGATFNCETRASCLSNQTLLLRLNSSESGSTPNNSHAQLANFSGAAYPYSVCCWTDAFRTLNNSCLGNGAAVVKLYSTSDSHVENGSGTVYTYGACMNVTSGNVSCTYTDDSCSSGTAIMSISSSEPGDANVTNAHIGLPGFYKKQVCCEIGAQNPPTIAYVNISPNNTATTREGLECQNGSVADVDGDTVTLHYNWYLNGTSTTVLNLPMDYNGTHTQDISGFRNHGALYNGTFSATNGSVGGGMQFDGVDDGIIVGNTSSLRNLNNFSVCLFAYQRNNLTPYPTFVDKSTSSINQGWSLYMSGDTTVVMSLFRDGPSSEVDATVLLANNAWHHICATVEMFGINPRLTLYINGTNRSSGQIGSGIWVSDDVNISVGIGNTAYGGYSFNGTIDEVLIFNRTLSAAEVRTLYSTGNRFFNSTELVRGNEWNCSITPVDSSGLNGSTRYSNKTTITGSAPLGPNLTYPLHNNQSMFERYVNFSWNTSTDLDGDQVNYTLNLTVTPGTCSVATTQSNLLTTNYTYGELCTDQMYNWTIRACDIDGCALSTRFNFTVASIVGIRLTTNLTQLGDFGRNQTKATDADGIAPFIINNTGNVRVNITLNGTNDPFSSTPRPTTNYQYKAGVNDSNAYNSSGSQTTYTPVDAIYKNLIRQLNYSTAATGNSFVINSTARIDMNITAPLDEPSGQKQGNITVQAVAG